MAFLNVSKTVMTVVIVGLAHIISTCADKKVEEPMSIPAEEPAAPIVPAAPEAPAPVEAPVAPVKPSAKSGKKIKKPIRK